MTEIPFYATRMGMRFYEHTAPELVRQLKRLNENLEKPHELSCRQARFVELLCQRCCRDRHRADLFRV